MNAVISKSQALKITGGRTPLVPVEYEAAVTSLAACLSIDDAKYWIDKADALAAWARIYRNDEAVRKAKALKLHAFRRMGALAEQIKPVKNTNKGRAPGPIRALTDAGLNKNQAIAARRLSTIPEKRFNDILEKPKAPSTVLQDLWVRDQSYADFVRAAQTFRGVLRRVTPASVANGCRENERFVQTSKELATEITEWLDDLDRRLSKKGVK